MKIIILIYILLLSLLITDVYSQDFTNIKDKKPIQISGGIGAKGSHFGAINEELKRDPFYYSLNANLNINFYGVLSVPLSFMYTKQDNKFNYPEYKEFGISPKYKAYTLHLGYRNIQFSQYTLSGLTFLGAGFEIKPSKSWVEFSGLYGQFQKPVEYIDVSAFSNQPDIIHTLPTYDRRGFGGKIKMKKFNQELDLIFFRAKDMCNSIDTFPAVSGISPAENVVLGINTQNKITKKISLKVEYAISAYTSDTRMPEVQESRYTYANNMGPIYTPRISSDFNSIINTNLNFQANSHSMGLNYKRVDPEYKSMGATYLNNDIEEFTFDLSLNIYKNKISLSGNIGSQHNNLDGKQATTMNRVIGSLNAGYAINDKINTSLNYSNFSSNTVPTRINLLDSIKYMQVTKNIGWNTNFNWGDNNRKQNATFLVNYQNASTINETFSEKQNSGNDVVNSSLSYNLNYIPFDATISTGFNYSEFISEEASNRSLGPSLSVNKSIFDKKIRIGFNTVYLMSYCNYIKESIIISYGLNTSYKISNKQTLSLVARFLDRKIISSDINSQQYQTSINYKYKF